jgi:thymidylate kinase
MKPDTSTKRAIVVAIEGIDGSGKSSHVASFGEYLSSKANRFDRLKMFRHGVFHRTVTDLVRACRDGDQLHLWRLERLFKVCDSLKYYYSVAAHSLATADIVVFDRVRFHPFRRRGGSIVRRRGRA